MCNSTCVHFSLIDGTDQDCGGRDVHFLSLARRTSSLILFLISTTISVNLLMTRGDAGDARLLLPLN